MQFESAKGSADPFLESPFGRIVRKVSLWTVNCVLNLMTRLDRPHKIRTNLLDT